MTFWKSTSDGNIAEKDLFDTLWETYTQSPWLSPFTSGFFPSETAAINIPGT